MLRLTKQEIVKEFLSCGKDPVYFIDSYCKLSHPIQGLLPFKTYPFQKDVLKDFNKYPLNIVLKSRQLGLSTIAAAYIAWLMMFHREKKVLVIATKLATASNLVKKVKLIIKNLPDWFGQLASVDIENRNQFTLTNGSEIKPSATSADAGRSEALSLVVIDEAAHIPNMEELWTALGPTVSTGGRVIAISSPYGVGNWFHQEYVKAERGENEFHAVKLPWNVHPDRDQEWLKKEKRKFSERRFAQEYDCSFLSSGETVIDGKYLDEISKRVSEPLLKLGFDRNFFVWEEFNPQYNYLITADVARGDGNDFSSLHVMKLETFEQVAEYRGQPPHEAFSKFIYEIGKDFGTAMVAVENNSLGYDVAKRLETLGYENLYYSEKGSGKYVNQRQALYMKNVVIGFTMSHSSRPLVINKLDEYIRNGILKINSKRTYNELMTFIWNNRKPEALKGHNDDLIMPLAVACQIKDEALQESSKSSSLKQTMLKAIFKTTTKLNTKVPGELGYSSRTSVFPDASEQRRKLFGIYKG